MRIGIFGCWTGFGSLIAPAQAGAMAAEVLHMIGEHVRPGVTTGELDTLARWGVTGLWLIGLWLRPDYWWNLQNSFAILLNYTEIALLGPRLAACPVSYRVRHPLYRHGASEGAVEKLYGAGSRSVSGYVPRMRSSAVSGRTSASAPRTGSRSALPWRSR